uniref:Theileria-specific sub-telomeric protein, SVSP family n=1 Tax=Theileria parva TaxID=5875 RepID=Q4N132_THEPA|eukprot:XP_764557.1 hypothetical protein [Theileria parva strain Muguga]
MRCVICTYIITLVVIAYVKCSDKSPNLQGEGNGGSLVPDYNDSEEDDDNYNVTETSGETEPTQDPQTQVQTQDVNYYVTGPSDPYSSQPQIIDVYLLPGTQSPPPQPPQPTQPLQQYQPPQPQPVAVQFYPQVIPHPQPTQQPYGPYQPQPQYYPGYQQYVPPPQPPQYYGPQQYHPGIQYVPYQTFQIPQPQVGPPLPYQPIPYQLPPQPISYQPQPQHIPYQPQPQIVLAPPPQPMVQPMVQAHPITQPIPYQPSQPIVQPQDVTSQGPIQDQAQETTDKPEEKGAVGETGKLSLVFLKKNNQGDLVEMTKEDYNEKSSGVNVDKYSFKANLEEMIYNGESIYKHKSEKHYNKSLTHNKKFNVFIFRFLNGFVCVENIKGTWVQTGRTVPTFIKFFSRDKNGKDFLLNEGHYDLSLTCSKSFRYRFLSDVTCTKIIVKDLIAWEQSTEGYPSTVTFTIKGNSGGKYRYLYSVKNKKDCEDD